MLKERKRVSPNEHLYKLQLEQVLQRLQSSPTARIADILNNLRTNE